VHCPLSDRHVLPFDSDSSHRTNPLRRSLPHCPTPTLYGYPHAIPTFKFRSAHLHRLAMTAAVRATPQSGRGETSRDKNFSGPTTLATGTDHRDVEEAAHLGADKLMNGASTHQCRCCTGSPAQLVQPGLGVDWHPEDAPAVVGAYRDPQIRQWHVRSMNTNQALAWIEAWPKRWR
jgi:hypothetical protein